jgi:putative membrane protein
VSTERAAKSDRTLGGWVGIYLRGVAMGIAEIVPGISGGTIAFVSGIYEELVSSLATFSPKSVVWLFTDPKRFWQHHNGNFLMYLALGMGTSVILFAKLMSSAIATAPTLVWGFFFGLIMASVIEIGRTRKFALLGTLGVLGVGLGFLVSRLTAVSSDPQLWMYFAGGALAVCAWLLPAISGSFVLLLLGLYTSVLAAVSVLDFSILPVFLLGCVTGLALFSRLLAYLMRHYAEPILSFLTGFMAGALVKLWPWQIEGELMFASAWGEATGMTPWPWLTWVVMVAGGGALWLLTLVRQ